MKIPALALLCLLLASSISFAQEETQEEASSSADDVIAERLKPFGKVCLEGEDCGAAAPAMVAGGGRGGKELYDQYCFACHATGLNEAPLVGDEAWQVRLDKGQDVLLENTRAGFNVVMPAMGTCMDCTDEELLAAIDYMVTGE